MKHLVIPDCQVTPDSPTDHLEWIGKYIVEKQPDVVVHLGDFADMESLSSYDIGKRQYEGRRYRRDIEAAHEAMLTLLTPLIQHNNHKRQMKEKQYRPRMVLTIGNHENRITRATENDAKLDGLMSISDLGYEVTGWEVVDYLHPIEIDGVHYSHYFYNPLSGRPYGGQSIDTRLKNLGFSFVQGHQQVYMVGVRPLNNGSRIRGLVCGSCYLHDEDYRGPQANGEWRGIFMLHEVRNGDYNLMEVSLDFLCRKYEGVGLATYMHDMHTDIYAKSLWMQRTA
jgi:hypothetical protein